MEPFWLLYLFDVAVIVGPEIAGARGQRSSEGDRKADAGSQQKIVLAINLSLLGAAYARLLLPALAMAPGQGVMSLVGTVAVLGGTGFRWYAIRVLGRFFTRDVAIRAGHRIVRDGPYRLLRHPTYAGSILAFLGVGILLNNWVSLLIQAGVPAGVLLYRIGIEEAAMAGAFGAEYEVYRRETKRLIPYIY